jgi:armadillo repeat-containing protein 6
VCICRWRWCSEHVAIVQAFDNSREFVAAGAVPHVMSLLGLYKSTVSMVPVVFGALKHLACDDKTCQEIVAGEGIGQILSVLKDNLGDEESASHGMSLLKTLAHADDNKKLFADPAVGATAVVLEVLAAHCGAPKVLEHALAAVAVVCLRHPDNCARLAAAGVFPLVAQVSRAWMCMCVVWRVKMAGSCGGCVQAMRMHPDAIGVQRQACLAIRNLVCRNPDLRPLALGEDLETLLRTARIRLPMYQWAHCVVVSSLYPADEVCGGMTGFRTLLRLR